MRERRGRRVLGLAVAVIGGTHFLVPRIFDPVNRLGFSDRARTFTYINGAIETTIGVLMTIPRTRRLCAVVSACYIVHLAGNIGRTQLRMRYGPAGMGSGSCR